MTDSLGVYLSVPFCKAKCTFCNFASDAFPPERMAVYVERLCAELTEARVFADANGLELPFVADTVFLGGGTPSLLEAEQMQHIFTTLRRAFELAPAAEITVEAAPGQISESLLDAMLASGVNRISLGVQSFVDAEARAVGRMHHREQCLAELRRLRAAGVTNLNVDLIAGLPHQTERSWAESLEQAIASGVEHVSVYMLEVDEDSRLGRELIGPGVRYSAYAAPSESLVADLYTQACETLEGAGLQQYEISNFARPGHASAHNLKYWTREPYLGCGLDAHSMLRHRNGHTVRFAAAETLDAYLAETAERELEPIDRLGAWEESIFLGLRLVEGVSVQHLRRQYPAAWVSALRETAALLAAEGLMRVSGDRIALTQRGRIVSSSIFGELLAGEPVEI